MEKIHTTRSIPSTHSPHSFRIANNKEEAIEWDREHFKTGTMIYTDGSCYKGMVGALAVIYIDGIKKDELRYQLGEETKHTLFKGELVGIILGTQLAMDNPKLQAPINFNIDNQATLRVMQNNCSQPGQYLIDRIHRFTAILREKEIDCHQRHREPRNRRNHEGTPEVNISFTWVAGHMNATGNEDADKLAKDTAEFGSSPPCDEYSQALTVGASL
jgi:ribonuclease HI